MEGVFLKDYPPEAFTIKCLEVATLENQPHTLNLLFQKGLTGSPCNGRRPSAVWEAPQVLDEEDPGKPWQSHWGWDKSYIITFRNSSLRASNWEGRLMIWDLRSSLEILCNQSSPVPGSFCSSTNRMNKTEAQTFWLAFFRMRLSTGRSECVVSLCWLNRSEMVSGFLSVAKIEVFLKFVC